jgi:hypothetical protein
MPVNDRFSFADSCYDLACDFLRDEPKLSSPINKNKLAQTIQDAIEDWIKEGNDALR